MFANPLNLLGAGAENRTRMTVRSEDFESENCSTDKANGFSYLADSIGFSCLCPCWEMFGKIRKNETSR